MFYFKLFVYKTSSVYHPFRSQPLRSNICAPSKINGSSSQELDQSIRNRFRVGDAESVPCAVYSNELGVGDQAFDLCCVLVVDLLIFVSLQVNQPSKYGCLSRKGPRLTQMSSTLTPFNFPTFSKSFSRPRSGPTNKDVATAGV